MQCQMQQGPVRKAGIRFRGEVARRSTRLITAGFAAGLLEGRLDQPVNLVNAEVLAHERGIEIVETSSPRQGDFSTLIQTEVTAGKPVIATRTPFGDQLL